MKFRLLLTILLLIVTWGVCVPSHADETSSRQQQALSKAEAIEMLTATDVVREKVGELLSWTVGYDLSKVKRAGLTPTIKGLVAVPLKVPPDGKTILAIQAYVDDPGGTKNISGVRADLSPIGRLSDTILVDTGLYGDQNAADGVYTLQTSVSPKTSLGVKEIPVSASNNTGWIAYAKTTLDIDYNPVIIDVKLEPERALADGKSVVTLWVQIENPGGIESIVSVTADLKSLGYSKPLVLRNEGRGADKVAGDNIFTLQFILPEYVGEGNHTIKVEAQNQMSGYRSHKALLRIYK